MTDTNVTDEMRQCPTCGDFHPNCDRLGYCPAEEPEPDPKTILRDLRKLNTAYLGLLAQARGERPARRICTCGFCLRYWGIRALAVIAANGAQLVILHHFGMGI